MVRQGTLTPSLAGSSPAIPANSSQASCSSFPNRTRFAGLRFGRGYLNSIPDPVAQLAEHLPFKQGVRSSNLRWVTKKRSKRFIACSVFLQWGGLGRPRHYKKCIARRGDPFQNSCPRRPADRRGFAIFVCLYFSASLTNSWSITAISARVAFQLPPDRFSPTLDIRPCWTTNSAASLRSKTARVSVSP